MTINKHDGQPAYLRRINEDTEKALVEGIWQKLITERHYRDRTYSARQLATDLHTNTRYVSVAIRKKFHMNYTALIKKLRVEAAMRLMKARQPERMHMQDVADAVGFNSRQSFSTAFQEVTGETPSHFQNRLNL